MLRLPGRAARTVASTALALTLVASVAACSGDEEPREDPGSDAETGQEAPPSLETTARLGRVVGRLGTAERSRLQASVTQVVDAWVDSAYLGDFPRTDFSDAFPGFTRRAAADAAADAALMSNKQVASRVEEVVAERRRVVIDALAVTRRPVSATARFVLALRLEGELQRTDRVRGRLFLTRSGDAWRVFGYDVRRGVGR